MPHQRRKHHHRHPQSPPSVSDSNDDSSSSSDSEDDARYHHHKSDVLPSTATTNANTNEIVIDRKHNSAYIALVKFQRGMHSTRNGRCHIQCVLHQIYEEAANNLLNLIPGLKAELPIREPIQMGLERTRRNKRQKYSSDARQAKLKQKNIEKMASSSSNTAVSIIPANSSEAISSTEFLVDWKWEEVKTEDQPVNKGHLGGSQLAEAVGKSSYPNAGPLALMEKIQRIMSGNSLPGDNVETEAMKHGKRCESLIMDVYEIIFKNQFTVEHSVTFESRTDNNLVAHLDGLVRPTHTYHGHVVEIKAPFKPAKSDTIFGKPSNNWILQTMLYMMAAGVPEAHLVYAHIPNPDTATPQSIYESLRIIVFRLDDRLRALVEQRLKRFLALLREGVPPGAHPDIYRDLMSRWIWPHGIHYLHPPPLLPPSPGGGRGKVHPMHQLATTVIATGPVPVPGFRPIDAPSL
jgi:hypothetical protein